MLLHLTQLLSHKQLLKPKAPYLYCIITHYKSSTSIVILALLQLLLLLLQLLFPQRIMATMNSVYLISAVYSLLNLLLTFVTPFRCPFKRLLLHDITRLSLIISVIWFFTGMLHLITPMRKRCYPLLRINVLQIFPTSSQQLLFANISNNFRAVFPAPRLLYNRFLLFHLAHHLLPI